MHKMIFVAVQCFGQPQSFQIHSIMNCFQSLLIAGCFFPILIHAQYKDITIAAGIRHGHVDKTLMGGGAALFDYNNDGWLDIYMTGGTSTDKLYKNLRNNRFEDVSWDLPHNYNKQTNTSTVMAGDLNNDGCTDLFLTTYEKDKPHILLRNNCDGTFSDLSAEMGDMVASPGIGAAFLDFNHDGLLDIYLLNYIDSLIYERDDQGEVIAFNHRCVPNHLLVNRGQFLFEDVTEALHASGSGCALAVAPMFGPDDRLGIYLANDFGEYLKANEFLAWDEQQGVFTETSASLGLDIPMFGMGIAVGDVDEDLDLDLYVTNMGKNAFLINEGTRYVEVAAEYKLDDTYANEKGEVTTGWGTFFFDFDNDADLDLFVANGFVQAARFLGTAGVDACRLFVNHGMRFEDRAEPLGVNLIGPNRGVVYGDIDRDGDLDLVTTNTIFGGAVSIHSSYRVFENEIENQHHYLDLELEGVTNNRDGFGARVYLHTKGSTKMQYALSGGTHASQSSKTIHFGLKNIRNVDSVTVHWPNGLKDVYYDLPVDQHLRLVEGNPNASIIGCMNAEDPAYNPLATENSACQLEQQSQTSSSNWPETVPLNVFPTTTQGPVHLDCPSY